MSEMTPVGVHLTPGSVRSLSNGHSDSGVFREPTTPQQATGNAVHAALAWTFRQPVEERTAESIQGALAFYFALEARCTRWASENQIRAWGLEARRMFLAYLTPERLQAEPLAVECQLRCVLPSGATLSGRADRIDETGGGIEIVDYKTGRCTLTEDRLPKLASAQVYAVAAHQMLNKPVVAVSFHYLRDGTVLRWELRPNEIDRLTDMLDALALGQSPRPFSD